MLKRLGLSIFFKVISVFWRYIIFFEIQSLGMSVLILWLGILLRDVGSGWVFGGSFGVFQVDIING